MQKIDPEKKSTPVSIRLHDSSLRNFKTSGWRTISLKSWDIRHSPRLVGEHFNEMAGGRSISMELNAINLSQTRTRPATISGSWIT